MEAGFPYSSDCLPDLSMWAEMLDKSPIKYTPQVHSSPPTPPAPCATPWPSVLPVYPEPGALLTVTPHAPR